MKKECCEPGCISVIEKSFGFISARDFVEVAKGKMRGRDVRVRCPRCVERYTLEGKLPQD